MCPILLRGRRCSVGRLLGLGPTIEVATDESADRNAPKPAVDDEPPRPWCALPGTAVECCRLRSIMIFLQMSRSALAMVRAGVSQRNTWHMWRRLTRSRATYAKSLRIELAEKGNKIDKMKTLPANAVIQVSLPNECQGLVMFFCKRTSVQKTDRSKSYFLGLAFHWHPNGKDLWGKIEKRSSVWRVWIWNWLPWHSEYCFTGRSKRAPNMPSSNAIKHQEWSRKIHASPHAVTKKPKWIKSSNLWLTMMQFRIPWKGWPRSVI